MRVDIIGGGISGLATAYYLTDSCPGVKLHVWEKDSAIGGLAGSFSADGFSVEKFYHHFYRSDTSLIDLMDDLGIGERVVWRPANTGTYHFKQPYRLASPLDLLRFRPLSLLDRIRLGLLVLRARRVREWESLDDRTAADFVRSLSSEQVYDVVWKPLLHGKFGSFGESVSAAWLWSKLVDRGGSRGRSGQEVLGYVDGGYGHLFERLASKIRAAGGQIHCSSRVTELLTEGRRIKGLVVGGEKHETDAVVAATQLPDVRSLVPSTETEFARQLKQVKFLGNVCLVLLLRRSLSDFYWTNVTEANSPFVGIIEHTNWVPPADCGGRHLVYVSAYCERSDPRFGMDTTELLQTYTPWIRRLLPRFSPDDVMDAYIWTADYAQAIVTVGYRHLVPPARSPIGNLYICTMAQIFPQDRQVSNAVGLARQVARMVGEDQQERKT